MKKILLLCDGDSYPSGDTRFIRQMRDTEPLYVKCLFYTSVDICETIPLGFIPVDGPYLALKEQELTRVHDCKQRFAKELEGAGIKYDIDTAESRWDVDRFRVESRFADLVVMSNTLFNQNLLDSQPDYFMLAALRATECPVAIIPKEFKYIERLAMAYDGEKESMHAMKQFIYLFPDLTELPTEIVHVKQESKDEIPNRDLLREYTLAHFDAQYTNKLHFDPKHYFTSWLEERKNVMMIAGSFSRSAFNNSFRKSFTEKIISEQTCAVFIAHFS